MSCHAILKNLYEPKMDAILTIRFKITAGIVSYVADDDVYRRFEKHNYVLSFTHCHGICIYFVFFTVNGSINASGDHLAGGSFMEKALN